MRAILCLILCCVFVACTPDTHLGQPSQQLIVLQSASGDSGCSSTTAGVTFRRIFPDGNGTSQPF